jgi:hypothetical protein
MTEILKNSLLTNTEKGIWKPKHTQALNKVFEAYKKETEAKQVKYLYSRWTNES